jgi:hypothetical protein
LLIYYFSLSFSRFWKATVGYYEAFEADEQDSASELKGKLTKTEANNEVFADRLNDIGEPSWGQQKGRISLQ